MINVKNLAKSYKKKEGFRTHIIPAIHDVSFDATDGKITGLLGENGAGKSTILRIICGVLRADKGSVFINGDNASDQAFEANKHIGFLPHNAGIYSRLSARENIAYYAEICGLSAKFIRSRTDELAEDLGMENFIDRPAEGFSQGQKTKVALARALIHKPQTLILDEPTNGLDVMATRKLRKVLTDLRSQGHCIVFSSHVMQEVAALCDDIAILAGGEIKLCDTVNGIQQKTQQQDLEDAFVVAIGEQLEMPQ